jgi:hypothetical protein
MELWIGIMNVTACVAVVLVVRTAGRDSCTWAGLTCVEVSFFVF